jgi:glycosyltransferase involved in cell wall biosynthesis
MRTVQLARRFVREDWGGTETVIFETSRRLLAMGHHAEVLCTLATARTASEELGGLSIRRYPYFYPYLGLKEEAKRVLDKKGGSPFSFALMRALKTVPDLDLIHLHVSNRIGAIGRHVARKRGIPYVVSLHGGVLDVPAEEAASWTEPAKGALEWGKVLGMWVGSRRILADAGAILCVGYPESVKTQERLPDKRVIYLPNGADTRRYAEGDGPAFRAKYGIPADARVMLTIARIDSQKNQRLPARMLPALRATDPDCHLLFVGNVTNPAYHEQLMAEVRALGMEDHVTIIPGIPSDSPDLVGAYHAADIFLLPSVHEPFGIVILEAWSAGLPVIASRVGGIPHFVEDGADGLLFDPAEEGTLVRAYEGLVKDSELRQRIAEAGRAKAREQFDWDVITRKLLGIYEEVIHENSIRQ